MSVLLYARVSTSGQADKELSIPAQLRAMRRLCSDRGWKVAASYTDVGSGTSLKERPGLVAAVRKACSDKDIDALLVHRLDRFARNLITHLTLRERLDKHGVRLVSAMENCEPTPMGQFIERIMAAQAEFYSMNLSQQVKGGLHERLRKGSWHASPPIGYIKRDGEVHVDPSRGKFVRQAFKLWSSGEFTSKQLADKLHSGGLTSRHGKRISPSKLCRILHNPFYTGKMVVAGKSYLGNYTPLVSEQLFEACQEVFRQKGAKGQARRHLHFLLARKIVCPGCLGYLVGEQHTKKSGRVYRYYRCHERACRYSTRAAPLEKAIVKELRDRLGQKATSRIAGPNVVAAKKQFDQLVARVEIRSCGQPNILLVESSNSQKANLAAS